MRRWDAMPDLEFVELIDGIVCMASPVSNPHFHGRMSYWLGSYQAWVEMGVGNTWLMSGDSVATEPGILEKCQRISWRSP